MSKRGACSVPVILDGTFFEIQQTEEGNVTAKCITCGSLIKGKFQPTSNFTTHLQTKHGDKLEEYKAYLKIHGVRNKRQKTLDFPVVSVASALSAHKERTERLIIKYIVNSMSPISTVEDKDFIELVEGLDPTAHVPTRMTTMTRIREKYALEKEILKQELKRTEWVCATADIWSARHRSFLGCTCHWIDDNYNRRSSVLAMKRFAGSHTGDRIAELLDEIFSEFGIKKKISFVITDNGSNFVKAFRDFGLEMKTAADDPDYSDPDLCDTVDTDEDTQAEPVQDLYEDLSSCESLTLPPHYRCASDTMSLVATTVLEKELQNPANKSKMATCKKIMRPTFAKCTAFWNKAGRSVKVDEALKFVIGCSIITPVITRWNSTFDSVAQLLKHTAKLDELFENAKVQTLKQQEKDFLQDYQTAVGPVAWALDKFQGENRLYFGYIAPILLKTHAKLESVIQTGNQSASALATALKIGLTKRFGDVIALKLESSKVEILAAISLPCFKLHWIPEDRKDQLKTFFICEAQNTNPANMETRDTLNSLAEIDDLFDFNIGSTPAIDTAELECLKYFSDPDMSLNCLRKYPTINSIFFKYNTALPSSAPAERLFNYGKMILRPQRSRMSDDLFEKLIFLKLNRESSRMAN